MIKDTKSLSRPEIFNIVNQYIGVEAGYLGDFSYQTHHDFYLEYCGIENINPYDYEGTTRERFIQILSENPSHIQAKILEGVLKKYLYEFIRSARGNAFYQYLPNNIALCGHENRGVQRLTRKFHSRTTRQMDTAVPSPTFPALSNALTLNL